MSTFHLPFDVLVNMFFYYQETSDHPLETLLLVCQLWKEAALRSKRIWSDLDIIIKDAPNAQFWSRQVPRRLARSGSESPIFFSLHKDFRTCHDSECTIPIYGTCRCVKAIPRSVKTILDTIAGPEGSLCPRWRRIDIGSIKFPKNHPFFSYPTPNLTSLKLKHMRRIFLPSTSTCFLPFTPVLREVELSYCGTSRIPNAERLERLRFIEEYDGPIGWRPPLPTFETLYRVRRLEVGCDLGPPYKILEDLPFLESLSLDGEAPTNMMKVQAPALRELSVKFIECIASDSGPDESGDEWNSPSSIIRLSKCHDFPFGQIEALTIEFCWPAIRMANRHWRAYHRLLDLCANVKKISGNATSTIFILKLLEEACTGIPNREHNETISANNPTENIRGTSLLDSQRETADAEDTNRRDSIHSTVYKDSMGITDRTFILSNGTMLKEMRAGKANRLKDIEEFALELGWSQLDDRKDLIRKLSREP